MGKHSHHKQVNDEGHKQGYRRLDEEVKIRLTNFLCLATVYIAGLLTENCYVLVSNYEVTKS